MKREDHLIPLSGISRIAIIGIGNELNGDDAAGILAVRALSNIVRDREFVDHSRPTVFLTIEAGIAPEAFTGPLRRFQPDLVILIDAAELGEAPGTIRWFDWSEVEGMSASTHTLPPSVLARYLTNEFGCHVKLIGIQPRQLEFDQEVSEEVLAAINIVIQEILTLFMKDQI